MKLRESKLIPKVWLISVHKKVLARLVPSVLTIIDIIRKDGDLSKGRHHIHQGRISETSL